MSCVVGFRLVDDPDFVFLLVGQANILHTSHVAHREPTSRTHLDPTVSNGFDCRSNAIRADGPPARNSRPITRSPNGKDCTRMIAPRT